MRPGWRQPSRPRAPTSRGYQRALHQFTVEEITEALARFTLPGGIRPPWFALGLALPSELRRMLRARGRDAYPEFVKLLPSPPPQMPIHRWSARRVGLWAILALVVLATVNSRYVLSTEDMVETPLGVKDVGCGDLEPLWLMAQSVPTASLVPCLQLLPVGWSVAEVAVNNGRSLITLNHDRGGKRALVVGLTAAYDPTVATEVTSEHPGARRSVRIDPTAPGFSATRAYDVPGGCVTQRFSAAAPKALRMSDTAATELAFITRQELNLEMERRSNGRLQLDPSKHHEPARHAASLGQSGGPHPAGGCGLELATDAVCGWRSSRGCRLGGPMGMTQSATTMPTTAPTVGPAIGAGLTDSMLGSRGSWRSRARAARHRWPGGGCSGLDNTVASQQGRRVGLSRPVGRAMDLPVDESTSPATQGLQQALQQGAGGRLRLDLGGFW